MLHPPMIAPGGRQLSRSIAWVTAPRRTPPTGLTLEPFRATRYAGEDLAAVTSPPYDVVEPDRFAMLESADPHNVVRLILPRQSGGGDRYHHAADVWRSWLQDGVLRTDADAALWVYEQSGPSGSLVGVVGTVPIDQPAAVLPHEDVMAGPVKDRAELMDAVGANLEPILLVHDPSADGSSPGHPAETTQLVDRVRTTPPDIELRSDDGAHHRLWAVTEPDSHQRVAADLSTRSALIADGHHRFAAYQQIQVSRRLSTTSCAAQPWDRGLALVVDGHAHPLALGAIHRTIRGLDWAKAVATAGPGLVPEQLAGLLAAERWLAAASGAPRLVLTDGMEWLGLSAPEAGSWVPRPDRSEQWRALPTAILHDLLIPHRWHVADEDVAYHHDVAATLRVAAQGGVGVLLPSLSLTTVIERAAAGERLPRKSTSFGPKPRTGLLMRQFD
jgi:uncharacterized protein (DUF1015 family)